MRAANIVELFTAQGYNLFNGSDPCAPGPTPTATLAAVPAGPGLLASQYGSAALISPAGQYNYLQGGNPDLNPETAKTYTIGGVFQYAQLSATDRLVALSTLRTRSVSFLRKARSRSASRTGCSAT